MSRAALRSFASFVGRLRSRDVIHVSRFCTNVVSPRRSRRASSRERRFRGLEPDPHERRQQRNQKARRGAGIVRSLLAVGSCVSREARAYVALKETGKRPVVCQGGPACDVTQGDVCRGRKSCRVFMRVCVLRSDVNALQVVARVSRLAGGERRGLEQPQFVSRVRRSPLGWVFFSQWLFTASSSPMVVTRKGEGRKRLSDGGSSSLQEASSWEGKGNEDTRTDASVTVL